MSDDKTPYILWHYTSIDTLIKICTNLTMRATHYKFMNDESELKLGIEEAKQQIKNNIFTNKNVQTLKYIEDELNKFADGANSREFYIISLSQERDKLSQWRSYTPSMVAALATFSRATGSVAPFSYALGRYSNRFFSAPRARESV